MTTAEYRKREEMRPTDGHGPPTDGVAGLSRARRGADVRPRPQVRSLHQVAEIHGVAHSRGIRALRGGRQDVPRIYGRRRGAGDQCAPCAAPHPLRRIVVRAGDGAVSLRPRRLLAAEGIRRMLVRSLSTLHRKDHRRGKGASSAGERIVVELPEWKFADQKQRDFTTWLRQGLLSFGRPGSAGNKYAIETGLKKRDSGAVMQDFLDDIKPAVKASGLRFPTPAEMRLEVPADLDWSLANVDETKAEGYATRDDDEIALPEGR